jgi:cation diffusion facilitator CzcD-associated flavoprotein CzcO
MEALKAQYASVFARCKSTAAGFIHDWDPRSLFDVSDAERERIFEERYDQPGFAMWLGNFQDLATSVDAADIVSDFIARKIRQRVKDPAVAERLIPKDHPFGARRVPMETGYYETYNQPNVRLIDVNETPVERITPRGVQVGGEELEFDVIVFATGFDAVRGAFDRIDIRGVDGLSLKEKWVDGPITYMGLQVHGFPNMFMLVGPHNGATFCNVPRCIEQNVEFVTAHLQYMRERGLTRCEPTPEVEVAWTDWIHETAEGLIVSKFDAWWNAPNAEAEGPRKRKMLLYTGGQQAWLAYCADVVANGYRGYVMEPAETRQEAATPA